MLALLIRHGHTEAVGQWLAGRGADPPLSRTGRLEAEALSAMLRSVTITAVYSSPLARARETARPLARDHRLVVGLREPLTDVDFGAWTGMSLDALAGDRAWQLFNRDRRHACPPRGESLVAVQRRIIDELIGLSRKHPGDRDCIAVVTHAEPIRCAIAAFEGKTLDEVLDTEISTAHVSAVDLGPRIRRVLSVNVKPDASGARVSRPYS